MWLKENKDNLRTPNRPVSRHRRDPFSSPEPVVSWSRGRETRVGYKLSRVALGTRMGPRRQGGEHEHAQYLTNDDVTSGWSCRRPENVSILSSLVSLCARQDDRKKRTAKQQLVRDKRNGAIMIFTWHQCFLVLYKKICLKELHRIDLHHIC